MPSRLTGAAVLGVLVLSLLAACTRPAGVDGNLTDDWPALPEAKVPVPAEGACYSIGDRDPTEVTKWPPALACAQGHTIETVRVGQFSGADSERSTPPPVGGPGRRAASAECTDASKKFLGGDWRTARLELVLITPTATQWGGGARWFRCDLVEVTDLNDYQVATRSAGLAGALSSDQGLQLGCFSVTIKNDDIDQMTAVECTKAHNAEFAGVFDAPDAPYPADAKARQALHAAGCRGVIASFAGVPNDGNFQYRTGYISSAFGKEQWELGNRGVRCFIWPGKTISRSLKGAGTAGLPINYR